MIRNIYPNGFKKEALFWINKPAKCNIEADQITITTEPGTDLWQKTYYGFQNDNAHMLQINTLEKFFSFTVKTSFCGSHRFDQCGIVLYLDSQNWLKASSEYENTEYQRLGSVVTNYGYSDWATTDISAEIHSLWYRLSRRDSDYCIEYSMDGMNYKQMRICHLCEGDREVSLGVYACSPELSSFEAVFTNAEFTECKWNAHHGGF